MSNQSSNKKYIAQGLNYGFQLVAAQVAAFFLGPYLDAKFNTSPWLTIVLAILFNGIIIYSIVKDYFKDL